MRLRLIVPMLIVATAVLAARTSQTPEPQPFRLDAKGAAAVEERSWEVRGLSGEAVGILRSAVRCGEELFISESQGKVRRLNVTTGVQSDPIGDVLPLSIASNCGSGQIIVVTPAPLPARGLAAITIDIETGKRLNERQVPLTTPPAPVSHVDAGRLYLGSVTPPPGEQLISRPASAFFKDVQLGTWMAMDADSSGRTFPAYDLTCPAAGACFETSLDTSSTPGRMWVVAQSASTQVGVYNVEGNLERRIQVTSPLFARTGQALTPSDSSEAMLRWSQANSRIYAAYAFPNGTFAVVHMKVVLPDGWAFGQPVQRQAWMNIFSLQGEGLISDIRLPDLPLGHDDAAIYVADYGKDGRQGATAMVRLVRIPVRTDRTAFR